MGRLEAVADAGIRLIARDGVRALTHRAVDAEAALPPGSTSYYARTRRELIRLVVNRITAQLATDLHSLSLPAELDSQTAAHIAEGFLNGLSQRADAQAARFALLFELRGDDLRASLTADDPVRADLVQTAHALLHAVGVDDLDGAAVDLVGLIDALLLYRTACVGPLDTTRVLAAYIQGLNRRHA